MAGKVAEHYKDITIGEWCGWHLAGDNDVLKCAAITGYTKEQVRAIKREKVDFAIGKFQKALNNPTSRIEYRFTLNGVDYGLIPDLTSGGLTMAEHIDLVNNSSTELQYETLPKVMAILYRPIVAKVGKHYEIEPYNHKKHLKNAAVMRGLSMEIVNGAMLFFSTIANELQVNSQLSLVRKLKKMKEQIQSDTPLQNTDGNTFLQKFQAVFYRKKNEY